MMGHYVFHIDVNSAFLLWSASYRIHILGEKINYLNITAIVGGDQEFRHGIVLAKSISAKKYDIQIGEPIVSAKKKCLDLVVLPPDYHLFVCASRVLTDKLNYY